MRKDLTLLWDLESDGLLNQLSKIHVIAITEHESGKKWTYRGDRVEIGVRRLMEAEEVVGHNIIGFDIPAVQKVFPWFKVKGHITDTLVCSRLMFSNQGELDEQLAEEGILPKNLQKAHGLESWGYRLGLHKGDYKKDKEKEAKELGITDPDEIHYHVWGTWNQEMEDYCRNDVAVTHILYDKILAEDYPEYPVELEHEMAQIMFQQEMNGFHFDLAKGQEMVAEMLTIKEDVILECKETFEGRYKPVKRDEDYNPVVTMPKRTLNYKSTTRSSLTQEAEYTKVIWKDFSPGSRDMVAERLIEMGWHPEEFTETGKPSLTAEVLEDVALRFPIAQSISDFYMVQKRIGYLATGAKALFKFLTDEGKIHGRVNACGAVTGRATHSNPNIAQIPALRMKEDEHGVEHPLSGKEGGWGLEFRGLFYAPPGFKLLGADLKSLEMRCLSHYMHQYDDGEYGRLLLDPDVKIHAVNQKAAGLATYSEGKRFGFAFLFGAGAIKLGSIVDPQASIQKQKRTGYKLKKRFIKKLPALGEVLDQIERDADRDGYLLGLDGRRLHIRHKHAALNTLLQSAGALIAKKWITLFIQFMEEDGYVHGWNGDFVLNAWIHDEIQVSVRDEIAAIAKEVALEAALAAGEFFELNLPIEADADIGRTWADTH